MIALFTLWFIVTVALGSWAFISGIDPWLVTGCKAYNTLRDRIVTGLALVAAMVSAAALAWSFVYFSFDIPA